MGFLQVLTLIIAILLALDLMMLILLYNLLRLTRETDYEIQYHMMNSLELIKQKILSFDRR